MGDTHSTVPYRLLFLDIDGVLNNVWSAGQLSCPLITALATMVRASSATVVLSSMWRLKRKHRRKVVAAFLQHGVPLFVSCTPHIDAQSWRDARGQEILAWLQLNTTLQFRPDDMVPVSDLRDGESDQFGEELYRLPLRIDVSHVVALDDIDLRREGPEAARRLIGGNHFVLTLMRTGLTEHNIRQAQHILSDNYGPIDMLSSSPLSSRQLDEKVLLPYSELCEQCMAQKPTHYDTAINKYFCKQQCVDDFYARYK